MLACADGRSGIVRADDLVRVTVAVLAGSGGGAGLCGLGMQAVRVRLLRIAVAVGAGNLFGRRGMAQFLHVLVAIDAGEHGAVDGVGELGAVDVEADRLAIVSVGQGLVGMAGEAVFIFEFVFGPRHCRRGEQRENQGGRKNPSDKGHTSGESFGGFNAVIRVTCRGGGGHR